VLMFWNATALATRKNVLRYTVNPVRVGAERHCREVRVALAFSCAKR